MEFIPQLSILAAFSVAAMVLAVTPGPDMSVFVSRSLTHGTIAGLSAMLGASTGLILHTLLAAFGVSALLAASPTGFFILKVVGALYLLWLAIAAIRHGSAFAVEPQSRNANGIFKHWLAGLGVNLLNPKIVVFFITFLPQFVSANDPHATSKMLFLGFYFILIAIIICSAIVIAASRIAELLRAHPRIMRVIDWMFAGVFGAFAARLLLTRA